MKKICFYLILLVVFALPSYLVRFEVFGIPTTLLEVLIYLAFLLTMIFYISEKRKVKSAKQQFKIQNNKIHHLSFIIPVVLFVIAGIIGIIMSPEKNAALGQFKAFIVDPILFFIVLVISFENCKMENSLEIRNWKLEILIKSLILSGALVALHAIYQKLTGDLTPDGRVVGIFGYSPNYLALYLTPIAILTMGYEMLTMGNHWENQKNVRKILAYDLAFLTMIMGLYFSGSRAGLGVTIISVSILLILRWWKWIRQKKIFVILLYCLIALLLVVGWWYIKPNWQLSPEAGGRITASNNIRWEIWQTSGKILTTNLNWLTGIGLGNYQQYFSDYTKGWVNYDEYISPNALTAHNLYLQTWFNLGLLGLISFIWIIILFFHSSLFIIHNSKDSKILATYYILLATMISILLYGLVDTPYWKNDLSVMFWLVLTLAVINKNILDEKIETKN